MRKLLFVSLVAAMLFSGCLLDNDDNNDKVEVDSIDQLSMGGSLFIFREQGFALSQFGTFYGKQVYGDASIFINGVKLNNSDGIYSKLQDIKDFPYVPGASVHIAVYALGDSIIKNLTVPDDPIILEPSEDIQSSLDASLPVRIAYPGKNDYSAMTLSNYSDGWELEADKTVSLTFIPGTFKKTGEETLNVFAINAADDKPEEFTNFNQQYELFLVAAVASRKITFTEAQ